MMNILKQHKSMILSIALISLVLVGGMGIGCANLDTAVATTKTNLDKATAAEAKLQTLVNAAKATATTLPAGDPVRVAMEAQIVNLQKALDETTKYIATANALITSYQNGSVSAEAQAALGAVPYGSYIGLALSLLLAGKKAMDANAANANFANVVKSWDAVGAPLTEPEKAQVAAIQGPVTTAAVSAAKAE